jgi:hypothetical protein
MKHRRRIPKILLGTIAFVLIVSVALGGFVWWKTAPPPRIDTVAALIEARDALQPEGADAWPRYVALNRGTLGMQRFGDRDASDLSRLFFRIGSSEFAILTTGEWDDPRLDSAKAMLREAQPIVEALRHATDAPACRAPIIAGQILVLARDESAVDAGDAPSGTQADGFSSLGAMQFPYFLRLLSSEARAAFEEDDFERYEDTIRRIFTLCEHLGAAPFDFAQNARSKSEQTVAYRIISLLALEGEMSPDEIDAMITIIDEPRRAMPLRDYLRAVAEVSTSTVGQNLSRELRSPKNWISAGRYVLSFPSPRSDARSGAAYLLNAAEVVDLPLANPGSEPSVPPYPSELAGFTFSSTRRGRNAALCARAATRLILLLERHHALTGEWPASLEDIMPREETLDPNTLTPFVYTLTPEGPFPFSLLAPPEADFIREEDRDFTKPRSPILVQ